MTSHPSDRPATASRSLHRSRREACGIVASATVALSVSLSIAGPAKADGQQCLGVLERKIESRYDRITHLIPEELEKLRGDPDRVLLLDVREESEHRVASLPAAERVEPSIGIDAFLTRYGDRIAGRTVVLYCSVGYRSSVAAARLRKALEERGATGVVNLRGGIFAWHNTGRPIVDRHGATVYVHPYSRRWQSYIDFSNLARTTPRSTATE